MADTKIDWADKVWNPTTGCDKVSQGCKHCYAETLAKRFWATQYPPNTDGTLRKFTDVRTHPERLDNPLRWKKPQVIFVDSMSDLFHPDVPDEFIYRVFKAMSLAHWHTFIILTKRAERMAALVNKIRSMLPDRLDHVWLGVSVEDQDTANKRIPFLLETRAAKHIVSYEPALGHVDFTKIFLSHEGVILSSSNFEPHINALSGYVQGHGQSSVGTERTKIDWLIMGCESGPGARLMDLNWARSARDQCQAAGVPFFFKQAVIDGKLTKMPSLDGKVWDQFPER